jgi:RNA polymerase sigma factor (sigma-70 family)
VLEHTPLIRYIVNRIAVRLPSHIDLDDLHNTGVIGLMDAIEKYDPEKNCKFKTYAEFRIKGAILDQLRSLDWVAWGAPPARTRWRTPWGCRSRSSTNSSTRSGASRW